MKKTAILLAIILCMVSFGSASLFNVTSESQWSEGTFDNTTADLDKGTPKLKLISPWDYKDEKLDNPFDKSSAAQAVHNDSNGKTYVGDTSSNTDEVDIYWHNRSYIRTESVDAEQIEDIEHTNNDFYVLDSDGSINRWDTDSFSTKVSSTTTDCNNEVSGARWGGFDFEEEDDDWIFVDESEGEGIFDTDEGFGDCSLLDDSTPSDPTDILIVPVPQSTEDRFIVPNAGTDSILDYQIIISPGFESGPFDIGDEVDTPISVQNTSEENKEGEWQVYSGDNVIGAPSTYNLTRYTYYKNRNETSGTYTSKQYDAGEKVWWPNISIEAEIADTAKQTANITVQTSDDGFSTVKESQTYTNISDGKQEFHLGKLSSKAQYLRFNWSLKALSPKPEIQSTQVNNDDSVANIRNLKSNATNGFVKQNGTVNISVETRDNDSGTWQVYLATNETGSFKNYTSTYDSPNTFGNKTSWTLSQFKWRNTSFNEVLGYKIWVKNGAEAWNVSQVKSFTIDTEPPSTQNRRSLTAVDTSTTTELYAQGKDNLELDYAVLSTNETGSFRNYTGDTYDSPIRMKDTSQEFNYSNFTWQNSSINQQQLVGWKIWYNDTSKQWASTGTGTFTAETAPNASTIAVLNGSGTKTNRINRNDSIRIRFNATDLDGTEDLQNATINLTKPNDVVTVKNDFMERINEFGSEDTVTYEYNFSMPLTPGDDGGEWNISVDVNDSLGVRSNNYTSYIYQLTEVSQPGYQQDSDASIYDDIRLSRTITVQNPSNTKYVDFDSATDIPTDTVSGSVDASDDNGETVSLNEEISKGRAILKFKRTLKSSSFIDVNVGLLVTNVSLNRTNFTKTVDGIETQFFQYNMTPKGETTFTDLEANQTIPNPDDVTQAKLFFNGTEVTNDQDHEFRVVDTNLDGVDDEAKWIVPELKGRREYELRLQRGRPIETNIKAVITNEPVTGTGFIEWRKDVQYKNLNNYSVDVSQKIRIPQSASDIEVDGEVRTLLFDDQGSYVVVSKTVDSKTNKTTEITYQTGSIGISTETQEPEAIWTDKPVYRRVNVTFTNNFPDPVTNAQTDIPIVEAKSLTEKNATTTLNEIEDTIEGAYAVNVSSIPAREDKIIRIKYELPVANTTHLGSRNISSGNLLDVWQVRSTAPTARQDVWFEIDEGVYGFDCLEVVRVFKISDNSSIDFRCSSKEDGADENGNAVVVFDSLDGGETLKIGVEHKPFVLDFISTGTVLVIVGNNLLLIAVLVLVAATFYVGTQTDYLTQLFTDTDQPEEPDQQPIQGEKEPMKGVETPDQPRIPQGNSQQWTQKQRNT